MKKYEVELSEEAMQDVVEIWNYITNDLKNVYSADKIVNGILQRCEDLRRFPKGYAIRMYSGEQAIRFVHFGKYTIAYCVNDENLTVEIFAIKYSRIDLRKLV